MPYIEAVLPDSQRKIKLKEITGQDERNALLEGAAGFQELERPLGMGWAMVMRSVVMLDGEPFDTSAYTPQTFRDLFSFPDYMVVRELFDKLHSVEPEALDAFRKSIIRSA